MVREPSVSMVCKLAQTTFLFSRVKTSAVLSAIQLPKYTGPGPWDLGLKCAVRHEDTEGMPRKVHPKVLLEFLASQSSAKPVESTFRRDRSGNGPIIVLPHCGDEVVHTLKHRRGGKLAPCSYQGSPPILVRKGVLWANEGNRFLLDHSRRVGLGLPCCQLHRGRGDLEGVRVRVLKVTEASTDWFPAGTEQSHR